MTVRLFERCLDPAFDVGPEDRRGLDLVLDPRNHDLALLRPAEDVDVDDVALRRGPARASRAERAALGAVDRLAVHGHPLADRLHAASTSSLRIVPSGFGPTLSRKLPSPAAAVTRCWMSCVHGLEVGVVVDVAPALGVAHGHARLPAAARRRWR